jgi:GntR family transcriptional regulator
MIPTDPRLLRYQQLRDELALKIARREWRAGEAIPAQEELASTYGIAVGTVRKAVDVLVAEGILERSQGRGTFVKRPKFDGSLFRFFRFQSRSGERRIPTSRILHREVVDPPATVISILKLKERSKAIHMLRLRIIEEEPLLIEDIWLPYDKFEGVMSVPTAQIGDLLYPAYEEHCNQIVASATETLTVELVTNADAKQLCLKPGTPIVVIERVAFGYDQEPLEWRCSRGPANHFHYRAEIR